tara:strand:+ start:13057 stop:14346 length:1290 start_codon:yes stop_codon:yes gene_type:complete
MNFDNFQRHSIPKLSIIFIPIYFLFESFSGYMFDKNGIVSYIFGAFWVLYFIFMHFKIGISKHNMPIIIFLLYLLFKVTMSSDILNSINQYATLFISLSIFSIAFKYFNNFNALKIITRISFCFLFFYFINLIVSNLFLESSYSGYLKDSQNVWNTGNIFTTGLNSVAFLCIATPIILPFINTKKFKIIYIILLILGIISVIVSFKRISILSIPLGYLIILLINKNLFANFRNMILILSVVVLSFPLYSDIINQQFEARKKTFSRGFQNESRYVETILVWSRAISFKSINESLFGTEMFNSVNNYGLTIDKKRMIHVDYNQILHGSGFLGLALYLYIHIYLIKKMLLYTRDQIYRNKILSNCSNDIYKYIIYSPSVFYSFVIISLFLSLAGGFHLVLFNSIKYLFLGSILGIWHNLYINKQILLESFEN